MKAIFACHFTINQSLLRLQERLQGTTYALDLIYILLNGKLHLLRVRAEKPRGLTIVWTLTGNLEMEPLFNLIGLQVIEIVAGLVSDTIFVDKALANCAGFPKSYSRVWFGSLWRGIFRWGWGWHRALFWFHRNRETWLSMKVAAPHGQEQPSRGLVRGCGFVLLAYVCVLATTFR